MQQLRGFYFRLTSALDLWMYRHRFERCLTRKRLSEHLEATSLMGVMAYTGL